MRLTEEQLRTIQRIVKPVKNQAGNIVGYKGISEAARQLKKSRPTIYEAVKYLQTLEHIEKAKRIIPKYVEEWEQSETVQRMKNEWKKAPVQQERNLLYGRLAWKLLGKKDPADWDEEDYRKLWLNPDFQNPTTGEIRADISVALRNWMDLTKKFEFKSIFAAGDKGPKGAKRTHYLKTYDEMVAVINNIQFPDTLVGFRQGTESGARASSLFRTKPGDIDQTQAIINMYEPKVKKFEPRTFNDCTINFIRKYIQEFNFDKNQPIYPRFQGTNGLTNFNNDLKQAGEKAKIDFDLTSHVGMKHTFVSQSSPRGLSMETIVAQTGTDPGTIRDYYLAIDQGKIRHEIRGEPYKEPTYHEFINSLDPIYRARYEQIRGNLHRADGLSTKPPKPKEEKPRKRRAIAWNAIESMVKNPKSPNIDIWKRALALHRQGLSDGEIRQRMGWK